MTMSTRQLPMLCLLLWLLPGLAMAQTDTGPVHRDHIEVELIAATTSVQPGSILHAGLRLLPDPGWHTYWKNPGDSGLPTRIHWTLPEGIQVSGIDWPYPEAIPFAHLISYGYEGEHLLPVTLQMPDTLEAGDRVVLQARAEWLVCEEICIPGDARLQLSLPVEMSPPARNEHTAPLFEWAEQRRPGPVDWPARFTTEGGRLNVLIGPDQFLPQEPRRWAVFVAEDNLVDHSRPADIHINDDQIRVTQPLSPFAAEVPDALPLVLVDIDNARAYALSAVGETFTTDANEAPHPLPDHQTGWLVALLLALVGGMLLNLMPCVFPVLSIKAMSLVAGTGHDQRLHGLAYTAGVVLSFAVLAALLLGLRASGEAIGWGFQLQSPLFVGVLVYLLFALGLSLSGVFDFGTRIMGLGQGLTRHSGLSGSFYTGILACVVASPCTAPFMGTALGVAVLMPWPMAMGIFLALGVGLALPMLALSFSPRLARAMPRPGPWMETFKQAMAFPLYLAVVWLLWVLARQTDANALAVILTGMVLLAFALWLVGRPAGGTGTRLLRHALVGLGLGMAAMALITAAQIEAEPRVQAEAHWEPWSADRLAALRADPQRAVLVNMTADWCVTCLVNERVALNTETVREALNTHQVSYLKGDWTRRDPAITAYLAEHGRNGVPLYVLYPREGGDPQLLPQVLTPALVVQALESL